MIRTVPDWSATNSRPEPSLASSRSTGVPTPEATAFNRIDTGLTWIFAGIGSDNAALADPPTQAIVTLAAATPAAARGMNSKRMWSFLPFPDTGGRVGGG